MESNLLISAKKYVKERKWDKAIYNLDQIMNQTKGNCDAEVYILYARCLQVIGNTNHAKKVLSNGLEQHPENEKILLGFLNLYDSLSDWHAAEKITLSLIQMNSEKAEYNFRLGRIYSFLNEFKKAEQAYRIGLQQKHQMPFEKLIKDIQLGFADDSAEVLSEYIFIDGKNNLGAFTHQYGNRKLFTKISKSSRGAKREVVFYKKICSDFPSLNKIVPLYIDSKVIDKIIYLTIEMIDDDVPIKVEHADKIITTASQISKIKYQDIINKYPNPNYLFQLRNRPTSVVIFFTQIHEKYYNKRLFSSFYKLLEQNNYPKAVKKVIKKIESLIMDNKLYLLIKPEKHYSLLQGDLVNSNIKIKKEKETPIILDWGTFTTGPHFMDAAKYLTSRFLPYSEVKRIYLSHENRGGKLSSIEKIFFLYAISLLYTVSISKRTMEERLTDFILPALNDMEVLISQLKENEFGQSVESLSIEKKEVQLQNIKLKKQIRSLEKEKQNLQTKFTNLLNSKSWKITAPLRKVTKWKGKRN